MRKADRLVASLASVDWDNQRDNDEHSRFVIVTVSYKGDISTFSPELAGLSHPKYGTFELGNIHSTTLEQVQWIPDS